MQAVVLITCQDSAECVMYSQTYSLNGESIHEQDSVKYLGINQNLVGPPLSSCEWVLLTRLVTPWDCR